MTGSGLAIDLAREGERDIPPPWTLPGNRRVQFGYGGTTAARVVPLSDQLSISGTQEAVVPQRENPALGAGFCV